MTQYSVDDQHGTNICGGLDERRARQVAQKYADELGAPVLLYSADGEEQIVEPRDRDDELACAGDRAHDRARDDEALDREAL